MTLPVGSTEIFVNSVDDIKGELRSDAVYTVVGVIDLRGFSIIVPPGGLVIRGYSIDVSKLVSSNPLFISKGAGSGNLFVERLTLESSKVHDLEAFTGFEAVEYNRVNFDNCGSLGEIRNYRQYLEINTGRFGGTPELTFTGTWNGARISTSIVRNIDNVDALFKTGPGLTFSGRFLTDINIDLPASGALFDFAPANFVEDESLKLIECLVTREGVTDSSDATITPNISADSVKCKWENNVGVPNTAKYIKGLVSAEVLTTVAVINTYYPLLGTITIENADHFDQPVNGEYRLLSGNGLYQITGNLEIVGTANDVLDIQVTLSSDGGVTFPTVINHISRVVNNVAGARDVAFFPINFISNIKAGERIRLEVENKTAANNVTQALDSYIIVSEA